MDDNKKINEKNTGKKPTEEGPKDTASTDWHALDIERATAHYATSKPPGRKYPVSMAEDMLAMFVDEDAAPPPPSEDAGQPVKKKQKTTQGKK